MQTDFEAADSPIIVNDWVENSTNGLIDSIVDESKPLFPPYVLLAINSIYLKATWLEQFEKRSTNLDSFYNSVSKSDEVGKAHFMKVSCLICSLFDWIVQLTAYSSTLHLLIGTMWTTLDTHMMPYQATK